MIIRCAACSQGSRRRATSRAGTGCGRCTTAIASPIRASRGIESVYRPAGAEAIYSDLRSRNLPAAQRRAYLVQQGYDPVLWPLLHDPTTHWEMFHRDRGRYYDWFWEDQPPYRHRRSHGSPGYVPDQDSDDWTSGSTATDPASQAPRVLGAVPYLVDLDREAASSGPDLARGAEPAAADYDVS